MPLGRAQECGSLWHWQIAWLGLKSVVCQELGRVAGRNDLRLWLHLSTPVPTHPLQNLGACSSLLSARAEADAQALHSLDEDEEVWDIKATGMTGTGWDLRALGGLVLCLHPSVVTGDTGLPSHQCGLCCPGMRRVICRASFPQQSLKYSWFVVLRAFSSFSSAVGG